MSLASTTRSETTKQFTTAMWWILAIVLFAYVGFTAAVLGFVFSASATGALPGDAPQLPAEGLPADALQHRDRGRLRLPAAHRHPDGHERVPPQDPHPDVPRHPAARARCSGRRSSSASCSALLYGVVGHRRRGRPRSGLPRRLRPRHRSSARSTPGRCSDGCCSPTSSGCSSASASARSCATRSARSSACWCSRSSSSRSARAAAAFVDGLSDVTQYLPGAASDALVGASVFSASMAATGDDPQQLEWWAGGLVLLGYAAVLVLLGLPVQLAPRRQLRPLRPRVRAEAGLARARLRRRDRARSRRRSRRHRPLRRARRGAAPARARGRAASSARRGANSGMSVEVDHHTRAVAPDDREVVACRPTSTCPSPTTPRTCVPGLGTPRSQVHASSVSCTLAMVVRSMTTFPRWNASSALGARQHDLELRRVEQQGHHVTSLPAAAAVARAGRFSQERNDRPGPGQVANSSARAGAGIVPRRRSGSRPSGCRRSTSTGRPARRASFAVRGPIAATTVAGGMSGNCACTCSATEPLVTRIALMRPLRTSSAIRSVTGTPTVRYATTLRTRWPASDEHAREHRLRDLAAEGQDVARLRLELDHLLGHPGRRVVALGDEIHAVADGEHRRGGRLADGGDLGLGRGWWRGTRRARRPSWRSSASASRRRRLRDRRAPARGWPDRCVGAKLMSGAMTGTAPCRRSVAATLSPQGPPRGTSTRQPLSGLSGVCLGAAFMGVDSRVLLGQPPIVRAADGDSNPSGCGILVPSAVSRSIALPRSSIPPTSRRCPVRCDGWG